ncbi:globin-like [Dermacentor albipictus]|uniref:globin-like n=1 Tax=Dermacentor albipictus TaxID=60249 RepID=UPI0031FC75B1
MGNVLHKRLSYQRCSLTEHDKKLIRKSWRKFCERNPDYGVRIFIGMFAKHPEYLQLFPRFRDMELRALRHDAKFRAHACAVGHQLSAIVECIEDDEVFVELIRKNAANHLPRVGVRPANFEGLFAAALEQMVAGNRAFMTPATVNAWERLFEIMNTITRNVYEEAAGFSTTSQDTSSADERSSLDPVAAFAEPSKTDAADAAAGSSTALGLVTTQEATAGAGTSEKLAVGRQDSVPEN